MGGPDLHRVQEVARMADRRPDHIVRLRSRIIGEPLTDLVDREHVKDLCEAVKYRLPLIRAGVRLAERRAVNQEERSSATPFQVPGLDPRYVHELRRRPPSLAGHEAHGSAGPRGPSPAGCVVANSTTGRLNRKCLRTAAAARGASPSWSARRMARCTEGSRRSLNVRGASIATLAITKRTDSNMPASTGLLAAWTKASWNSPCAWAAAT